jgi:hypothetical protein
MARIITTTEEQGLDRIPALGTGRPQGSRTGLVERSFCGTPSRPTTRSRAESAKFEHPDEDALDMLVAHYPGVPIHFTDATPVIQERALRLGVSLPRTLPLVIEL